MAHIFNKVAIPDNILVMETHESVTQPFTATNWTDLRIGMMVSLTNATADDIQTGLTDSITGGTTFNPAMWAWVGIKDGGPSLPGTTGTTFIGFTNANFGSNVNSTLVTSDLAYGSSPYYWLATNSNSHSNFMVLQGFGSRLPAAPTIALHMFQATDPGNPAPPGYYTGMFGIRLTRPSPTSNVITVQVPQISSGSADMYWSALPTLANLLAHLDPWPGTVVTLGPIAMSNIPNALFCFWPFSGSRIRVSAWGVMQAA